MPHANAGIHLAEVLRETIARHEACGRCRFNEGAAERLIASPEFRALAALVETEEAVCERTSNGSHPGETVHPLGQLMNALFDTV